MKIRIYVNGLMAYAEIKESDHDITWSTTSYADGHREGILYFPNGDSFCIDEIID